jgi:3',5'-cyclic AMP phosphodiesterase CpdA
MPSPIRPLLPSRRSLLKAGLIAGAAATPLMPTSAAPALRGADRGPAPLRVAHLTDVHITPERRAAQGFAMALESLKTLDRVPDLLITGGDHVMDVFDHDAARAKVEWDLYEKMLGEHCKLKTYPVMGNHDVFGWGQSGQIKPDVPGYGKAMAIDRLKMPGGKSYYSFDAGGWHFVVLDNIARRGAGYFGGFDPANAEQADWLRQDLQKKPAGVPVCVASHIPILSACVFFDGADRVRDTYWHVPDAWMHRDCKPLIDLLRRHDTKVCLSGHMHLVDRVDYLGVSFLCNGAVCGHWWEGPQQEFDEGYAILDLWPDGTFEHKYVSYGWKA